jgi:hypothetical protein
MFCTFLYYARKCDRGTYKLHVFVLFWLPCLWCNVIRLNVKAMLLSIDYIDKKLKGRKQERNLALQLTTVYKYIKLGDRFIKAVIACF